MKRLIIVNEKAGNGLKNNIIKRIEEALIGTKYEMYYSTCHNDIKRICSEIDLSKYIEIIVIGGDGSISEALNGIMYKDIPLKIIPNGSGNDLYRSIHDIVDIDKSIENITQNNYKDMFIGIINDELFSNVISVGIDAYIVKIRNSINKFVHGRLLYLLSAIIGILIYKPKDYIIEYDGKVVRGKYYLIAIGNGKYYGGGMKIAPMASIEEEQLDICMIKNMNRLKLMYLLPSVYSGKHLNYDVVEYFKCKNIRVKMQKSDIINIDGELTHDSILNVKLCNHKQKIV